MTRPVRFSKLARQDIDAAVDWFDAGREGLGDSFLLQLDAAVQRVRRHPEIGSPQAGDTRRTLARRFPYSLFYRVRGYCLEVVGVLPQVIDSIVIDERL